MALGGTGVLNMAVDQRNEREPQVPANHAEVQLHHAQELPGAHLPVQVLAGCPPRRPQCQQDEAAERRGEDFPGLGTGGKASHASCLQCLFSVLSQLQVPQVDRLLSVPHLVRASELVAERHFVAAR